jgi:hypothetical protein
LHVLQGLFSRHALYFDFDHCGSADFRFGKLKLPVRVAAHDDGQGYPFFIQAVDQDSPAEPDDALVFHAPSASLLGWHDFGVHIEFEADARILPDDLQLSAFLRPMEIERSLTVSETQGHDVGLAFVAQTQATNPRVKDNGLFVRFQDDFFFFSSHYGPFREFVDAVHDSIVCIGITGVTPDNRRIGLSQGFFGTHIKEGIMAKAQDTRKENKKKPAQSLKEKRKAKQDKKKGKE